MTAHTGINDLDDILNRLASARSRDEHDDTLGELAAIAPDHISTLIDANETSQSQLSFRNLIATPISVD